MNSKCQMQEPSLHIGSSPYQCTCLCHTSLLACNTLQDRLKKEEKLAIDTGNCWCIARNSKDAVGLCKLLDNSTVNPQDQMLLKSTVGKMKRACLVPVSALEANRLRETNRQIGMKYGSWQNEVESKIFRGISQYDVIVNSKALPKTILSPSQGRKKLKYSGDPPTQASHTQHGQKQDGQPTPKTPCPSFGMATAIKKMSSWKNIEEISPSVIFSDGQTSTLVSSMQNMGQPSSQQKGYGLRQIYTLNTGTRK